MSGSTLAVSEASDLMLKDISMGIGVAVTKGSHNAVSRPGWGCDAESAVGIAAGEDGRALANVFKRAVGASHVAGVVLTLLVDESRKNPMGMGGNGGLNGNDLFELTGNVDGDDRGSRRGSHRDGAGGVGGIGEDSIILLEDHGGECNSCDLQKEEGEDDKESKGLVNG